MEGIHGGDVYRNHVDMDFSVNVNPLGMPKAMEAALHKAVESCQRYPDLLAEKPKRAVCKMLKEMNGWKVLEEQLLFGNGASELFMAIVHGVRPEKTVIPVPSFYGYEYAAQAGGGEIIYCGWKEEDLFQILTEEIDLVFLANPNNPTGRVMGKETVTELLRHCSKNGILVILDECFAEFCENNISMLPEIEDFENLVIVRAFTKIFSIPGVRLGYLVCSNPSLLERIGRQLPEWNLSCFAQAAGCVCGGLGDFVRKTAAYVKAERGFLEEGLKQAGLRVFPSETNFILVYSETPLYAHLLERGILIRDCKNFRGLGEGFYRIAVKSREENEMLLKMIGEINWKESAK